MWWMFAIGSAVFAALTSILAKIGIENVNSNLATAIRTVVVLVMAWGMVFLTGAQSGIRHLTQRSMLFLVLSGLAPGRPGCVITRRFSWAAWPKWPPLTNSAWSSP